MGNRKILLPEDFRIAKENQGRERPLGSVKISINKARDQGFGIKASLDLAAIILYDLNQTPTRNAG
jgi:hypothetical protein